MERYYKSPQDVGKPRPAEHYRGALRNAARLSYRIAKKTMRQQQKS